MRLDPENNTLTFTLTRNGEPPKLIGTLNGVCGILYPSVCMQYDGDAVQLSPPPMPNSGGKDAGKGINASSEPTNIHTQTDVPVSRDPYACKAYYVSPEGRLWHALELMGEAESAVANHKVRTGALCLFVCVYVFDYARVDG
jgi:hypothetical protein